MIADHGAEPENIPPAIEAQARHAYEILAELHQHSLAECGHSPDKPVADDWVIQWSPAMSAAEFAEQVFAISRRAVSDDAQIIPGRVYCYHCTRSDCEHSTPNGDGKVFAGYRDTGRPIWEELFNFLAAVGDTRVDLLFAPSAHLLGRVVGRRQLISQQLDTFGRNHLTYHIVGQVVAGYFQIRGVRCAMTVQVVQTPNRELSVQVITPDANEALSDAPENRRSALYRTFDALREFNNRIRNLSGRWLAANTKADRDGLREQLFTQLRHLSNSIQRKGRQKNRRTSHAEVRSKQRRPVHKALEDLRTAGAEDFFRDNHHDSIIVIAKGGRAHVFSEAGRHITSLSITADVIERRQRRKRYIPMPPKAVAGFREVVTARNSAPKTGTV